MKRFKSVIRFFLLIFLFLFNNANEKKFEFKFNNELHTYKLKNLENNYYLFELYCKEINIGYILGKPINENIFYIDKILIHPGFREKKYAEFLIKIVIFYAKYNLKAQSIMLYPCPFELSGDEFENRKEYLFKYYSKFGL